MSSQLMHPAFNTNSKSRKKKSARQNKIESDHEEWLRSKGLSRDQIAARRDGKINAMPSYKVSQPELSNSVGNGFKKQGVMERLSQEAPAVRDEILRKASRTAPGYNKGNYIYVTDGMDPAQVGTRSRRP